MQIFGGHFAPQAGAVLTSRYPRLQFVPGDFVRSR
jgi:hypothetical protein